ncbi:MAG: acyl-CoA dehydratase activase [Solirubrobacterales bacterium]
MITAGVDIGSSSSKVVIMAEGKTVLSKAVIPIGTGSSGPAKAFEKALVQAGLHRRQIAFIVATGYGRNHFSEADDQLSEITCHARGVFEIYPKVQTVIDIGGQDAKAISINRNGTVSNFVMNDKCAAGTGRFLDVMSRILEVEVDHLAALADGAKNEVAISNTCTVFAESEVISQLASGQTRADVAAGLIKSVVKRVAGLARRVGIRDDVVMTGGVSLNWIAVRFMQEELGHRVLVSPDAQITGALGAAIIANHMMCSGKQSRVFEPSIPNSILAV